MRKPLLVRCGLTTFFLNAALWGHCPIAQAQIITDGTVGPAGSLSGPNYTIPAALGQKFGANLFHSFLDFQLAKGESATFTGPTNIHNILSRVTGGVPSTINGQLNSTISGANFFFLNPSGVVFGPSAQINVGGSFVVSTADAVKLGRDGVLTVRDPSATVLTSSPPQAFGFISPIPKPVLFYGNTLSAAPGRSFSVVAGGIGVYNGAHLNSTGGLNLVSVGSPGAVFLDADNAAKPIDGTGFTALGGIEVKGGSELFANGAGGMALYGQNLLVDRSGILATNDGSSSTPSAIDIKLAGPLVLDHGSIIQSITGNASPGPAIKVQADQVILNPRNFIEAFTQGRGQGGSIDVEANRLQLGDGASIVTSTQAQGNGGALNIAVDDLQATGKTGDTGIFAITQGDGNGGDLTVTAKNIALDKASMSTNSIGAGDSGALTLSTDTLLLDGGDTRFAGIGSEAHAGGDGGAVTIIARDIEVRNGANISTSTIGAGRGGSIDLTADSILLEGKALSTGIQAASAVGARGAGGTIVIRAGKLQMIGNASVQASTLGTGAGGAINISADQILLDGRNLVFDPHDLLAGNGIYSESRAHNSGIGGKITIATNDLEMQRGSVISTDTASARRGGSINITAGNINIDGREKISGIVGGTEASGQSGKIRIKTDALNILGQGVITTSTFGQGAGGEIVILAKDIVLDGANSVAPKGITSVSQPGASGHGGNITIRTDQLKVLGRIGIDNSTTSSGNSGSINLHAKTILLDGRGAQQSGISSSSVTDTSGDSGKIHIQTGDLQIKGYGSISSVTAGHGQGSEIDVTARNILIDAQNVADVRSIVSDTGGQGGNAAGGTIIIKARNFTMQNGALVSSNALGAGKGGSISITASDTNVESGSFVSALTFGSGNGGDVTVTANNLTVDGKGTLTGFSADTAYFGGPTPTGNGDGGTITLIAPKILMTDNAYASTSTINQIGHIATGKAGQITITNGDKAIPGQIGQMVLDRSLIASISSGSGNGGTVNVDSTGSVALNAGRISAKALQATAGDVSVTAADAVRVGNGSSIDTEATKGNGGNINISVGRSFREQFSVLSAFANGNGGNVTVAVNSPNGQNSQNEILLDRAQITANAVNGTGGRILLRSRVFLPSADSRITASSTFGTDGTVNIESPNTNVGGSLIILPQNLLDAESFLSQRCVIRETGALSSFTIEPLNGTPAKPGDLLPSPAPH